MKTRIAFIACFCLAINSAYAQWENDFKLKLKAGYEYNIFKAPTLLVEEDDVLGSEDLLNSGFFEGLGFSANFLKKIKDGRLKINLDASGANVHTEINTNLYQFGVSVSYRKKFKKGRYFEIAPSLNRKSRQGQDESDAVLRTTLSYINFRLPVHVDFYLGNKAWFKTESGYIFKAYDQNNLGEKVSYHAAYTGFTASKKWEKGDKTTKLSFTSNAEYRQYTDLKEDEDAEEDEEGVDEEELIARPGPLGFILEERQWLYLRNNLEYDVSSDNSPLDFTLGLYSTIRVDSEKRFGYTEVGPGVKMAYNIGKTTISGGLRYSFRRFGNLNVADNGNQLQYTYLRSNIRLSQAIGKGKRWYIQGNMINRKSNRTDNTSTAFRGFNYSLIETGFTIRF